MSIELETKPGDVIQVDLLFNLGLNNVWDMYKTISISSYSVLHNKFGKNKISYIYSIYG